MILVVSVATIADHDLALVADLLDDLECRRNETQSFFLRLQVLVHRRELLELVLGVGEQQRDFELGGVLGDRVRGFC